MRRAVAVLVLPMLFACTDTPTQPRLDVPSPAFEMVVGSGATWYFEAVVDNVFYDFRVALGDTVTGQVTFKILDTADLYPDNPCLFGYRAQIGWEYTINGTTYPAAGDGEARSYCAYPEFGPVGPAYQLHTDVTDDEGFEHIFYLDAYNPAVTEDFPLEPPALREGLPNAFWYYDNTSGTSFKAGLTKLYLGGPTTKQDCMKGGWQSFGFSNQGQCIRYIETGKDSR
jgi:hypothetical protein